MSVDASWLFGSAPDAMLIVDGQGRIASVNAQAEKMFGYRREELVGEPLSEGPPRTSVPIRCVTPRTPHGSRPGTVWPVQGRQRVSY
jgi:PAS domain-containing protein